MSDGRIVIDITGDASGYERAVRELGKKTQDQLSSISGTLSKAGSALTSSITVPAFGAASAVGSIFIAKGWQRLEAIDTAQAKLKGLGYTAGDIQSIMDSALTSVKGTAYGLGDAATTAVGALAAGVTKGDDLTRVLRTIGDVATIAGGDFQGVASVFNKVMSKGKLQGDEILQLSERGVPVLQILAKHLGVSAEKVSELASEGEIGFATFEGAMRNAFGGAALQSGESMRGTIENTWAAVSRVGAAFLEGGDRGQGFFDVLKPLLGELTSDLDGMSGTAGEWGAAFGGAVLEGVQICRELLAAFDGLLPSEKQQVAQLVGMALAAGPVLKVGSRLVSGVGALVGVLAKSAAVSSKVIGGARGVAAAYAAQQQAQRRYIMDYEGSLKVVKRWDKDTQSYVKTSGRLKTALASGAGGAKAQAAASLVSAKAMDVGKVAARGFGTALKAIAPIAILSGIIALASAIADNAKKTETYAKATSGLEAAASGATIKINEETGAVEALSGAAGAVDLDRMAQEHADLAQSITDTNQSMVSSAGMLDGYGATIEALAGRTELGAEDIASLKLAVDGVNDACGTSYTVAQDANGAWQVYADGAVVAKDAIQDLIDTQLAQIRLEAAKESYKETYAQLTKDTEAYTAASADATAKQDALNAKLAELKEQGVDRYWTDQSGVIHDWAETEQNALNEAQANQEQYRQQLDATQSAANRLEEQQKLATMAMAEGASEIMKLVDGNLQMKAAIQQTGTDLVGFTQALESMGFTAEQVSSMTPEQAAAMAKGWQGGTLDMIAACEQLGIEVPDALRTMGDQAKAEAEAAAHEAGQGMATGLAAETETVIGAAMQLTGLTRAQFDKLAAEAGIEGDEATAAFAQSLAEGGLESEIAAKSNALAAEEGFGSVNGADPANQQAGEYADALNSPANLNATARAGQELAQTGYDAASSKNDEYYTSGYHAASNIAAGLREAIDVVSSAASAVAGAIASVIHFSVPKTGPWSGAEQGGKRSGRHLVQNIAAGMISACPELTSAAQRAADVLWDGIDRMASGANMPTVSIPFGLSFAGKDLDALSAFGFTAALEDRSGRDGRGIEASVDLTPVTDALGRIEERIDAAAERTAAAYSRPVKVNLRDREIARVIREHM